MKQLPLFSNEISDLSLEVNNPALSFLTNKPEQDVKVATTLKRELGVCNGFWFSVAFVTPAGVATIIQEIYELERRGVQGRVVASNYLDFTHPEALRKLGQFSNIQLRLATQNNYHAKGYYFNRQKECSLIIGSSNLTDTALSVNTEWNLMVRERTDSQIIQDALTEFEQVFNKAEDVTEDFLRDYREKFFRRKGIVDQFNVDKEKERVIEPNAMQKQAITNLTRLRKEDENKALLISATGTGKTYLSAFDARNFKAERLLFLVHRHNIAQAAENSFQDVLGKTITTGQYNGIRPTHQYPDYLFATVQTFSRDEHLHQFQPNHFDYIVIDETHRAEAKTYQKILNYFQPRFLLGMTATPERTDTKDIFQHFDNNIAYEIRLHQALEEGMLSPFHYYGITDLTVNGRVVEDDADFRVLVAEQRVEHIIQQAAIFGCDDGLVRGLIFCSKVEECRALSELFNERGFLTRALDGSTSIEDREEAMHLLETDDLTEKLDYLFTVDIFNEGIDIPRVNQVIMLRPTQSAIIFVQQLGRGLRKTKGKEYLTVLDFIGNYQNNYMVPIALYGDTSLNKDRIREQLVNGSRSLPGTSTVNFDRVSKERIFTSLNSAKTHHKSELKKDYNLLKLKLGRIPSMMDFLEDGARDPFIYVTEYGSYYHALRQLDNEYGDNLSEEQANVLAFLSSEVNNAQRIVETLILNALLKANSISCEELKEQVRKEFDQELNDATIHSALRLINLKFHSENDGKVIKKLKSDTIQFLELNNDLIERTATFNTIVKDPSTQEFLADSIKYALDLYGKKCTRYIYQDGFFLYQKYSRKDVFRILNWKCNPNAQNVGGYKSSADLSNCPIFTTYNKPEGVAASINYQDKFIDESRFSWMSRSKRKVDSKELIPILNPNKHGTRLPFFLKKDGEEKGAAFHYMGDFSPVSHKQSFMPDENGKDLPVVNVDFEINPAVQRAWYEYFVGI